MADAGAMMRGPACAMQQPIASTSAPLGLAGPRIRPYMRASIAAQALAAAYTAPLARRPSSMALAAPAPMFTSTSSQTKRRGLTVVASGPAGGMAAGGHGGTGAQASDQGSSYILASAIS